MRAALIDAQQQGARHFVIVSHNFEMLKPGSVQPDWVVVRRFKQLCAFLGQHRDLFAVGSFAPAQAMPAAMLQQPRAGRTATVIRYAEQALRRLL
ncbi:MAG: hypothetical protein H7172_00070 [Ferruginibacter sp.]|nr:hypothetical protein [Rhodoferax sp.]